VSPGREHLGVLEPTVRRGRAPVAGVDEEVREGVVRGFVLVVVGDAVALEEDKVVLTLAVVAERVRPSVVPRQAGDVPNSEVE